MRRSVQQPKLFADAPSVTDVVVVVTCECTVLWTLLPPALHWGKPIELMNDDSSETR